MIYERINGIGSLFKKSLVSLIAGGLLYTSLYSQAHEVREQIYADLDRNDTHENVYLRSDQDRNLFMVRFSRLTKIDTTAYLDLPLEHKYQNLRRGDGNKALFDRISADSTTTMVLTADENYNLFVKEY